MNTVIREKTRVVSVIHDRSLNYPQAGEYFSPDQAFPEYQFPHIARKPNTAYSAVRQCLAETGLDVENFGKPTWNPLRNYITPGQKVFVLCNFVKHNIRRDPKVMLAKCTHGSVVRAVIDYVLLALGGRGSVVFGNAPLQSADWSRIIQETGAQSVQEFYTQYCKGDVSVRMVDLRQHIVHTNNLGIFEPVYHGDDADFCAPVDLGSDSLLDGFYRQGEDPKFRVLDYDPRRIERCHGSGRHVYLINRLILESNVIISIPKLKTHEKVGFTGGIKGCVGTVGHKDCLAHHRFGSPHSGGDEYPDHLSILKPISYLHDTAYSRQPSRSQQALSLLNDLLRKVVRRFTRSLSGAWPGNDTCWRMAVDIARIVEYATVQGRLQPEKQRTHIMLTDGIIAGEGDGPLSPRPVSLGYLSFSDDVAAGDYVNCLAMGFDPEKIPMIREAFRLGRYPLTEARKADIKIRINGEAVRIKDVGTTLGRKFLPPREWRRYL
jgi:uncharacterized protein (DUF362 family)